ncbi:MAG: restriction endonuclease subunit S [Bifidobacterium adolescentis]
MAEQHGKALVPQIRFAGFADPWEQRKLGELTESYSGGTPAAGESEFYGGSIPFIRSAEIAAESTELFLTEKGYESSSARMVKPGDVLYALYGATSGEVAVSRQKGAINQAILAILPRDDCDARYITAWLRKQKGYIVTTYLQGGQGNLSGVIVKNLEVFIPSLPEQQKIGFMLSHLDSLITLHQRKYDKLCVLKKSMLDKMFPKGGSLYPEIRFAGFTDPWEQRKLSELVEIERGGSPRPIERYITDDPCGLNWVKIGDAPELGRYITQTTEKIKPEGLAKTRQVYPGDLVLSNSMSFGRPYIMAIKGCIHDGWLLIRDAQKHFDPIFLCHMLGAPQMLNQYRMFAAGSTVNNLNKELVGKAIVSLPSKDEQREIGIVLDRLDSLITLHQRKLELLRNIKKSMLDKMFV